MTEITLNLTLEELKQIDKFVELNDETRPLFDKIRNAYPKPKTLFDVIYDLGYTDDMCYEIVDAVEKFEKSKEPEDNEWKTVALGFGENLSAIGPCGYYDFTPVEWYDWVVDIYENTANEYLKLLKKERAKAKAQKPEKWDVVRESVKWWEEHREESLEDYLTPQERGDRIHKEVENEIEKLQEKNWYVDTKTLLKSKEPEENDWKTVALLFGKKLPVIPPYGYDELSPNGWYMWVVFNYDNYIKQRDIESGHYPTPPQTPEQIEKSLREAFKKVQQTEEWKETQRKIDSNYDELVESGTAPPEPTSTAFRQKLFDGIKSVFYDPDYERTHWKLKVDMAVDEVLTHFYDILPEPFEKEIHDDFEKGWNSCLKSIEIYMEFGDD